MPGLKYYDGATWKLVDAGGITDGTKKYTPSDIENIENKIKSYSSYASAQDGNGIYTVVDFKRVDNTLYMRSTLSNLDIGGNYQTVTWNFYDNTGALIVDTKIWALTYDANENIISKVVS